MTSNTAFLPQDQTNGIRYIEIARSHRPEVLMELPKLLAIAIALAMDAFAVAIATGVQRKQVSLRQTLRLSWHFGLFQAIMPITGWVLGLSVRTIIASYAHWVAFFLLTYIGIRMLKEAYDDQSEKASCDPTKGLTMVMLAVATSIDALAIGISLAILGVSIWYPAGVIGVVAFVFTAAGLHIGRFMARAKYLGLLAELAGGITLLAIGLHILWKNTVF